jgi:DNA (cytosine-5)-methyltransferase 1
MNYYNEFDPFASAWLRELIKAGHIPQGIVDERSIEDVLPGDLVGFNQCHFFAGIGGWSLALRIAGVPDDYQIWTGSCPCQPFSAAGNRSGANDSRHLWPHFRWLIQQRKPAKVAGEQVASADGRAWFSGVQADLEALGYGAAAADLCSAGIGAPHIRQRLYWFADSGNERVPGFQQAGSAGQVRQGRQDRSLDLRQVIECPYEELGGWPKPLICREDDGISTRVGRVRGYGNAIDPELAAEFLIAALS